MTDHNFVQRPSSRHSKRRGGGRIGRKRRIKAMRMTIRPILTGSELFKQIAKETKRLIVQYRYDGEEACTICLGDIKGKMAKYTHCGHVFCCDCLNNWFKGRRGLASQACPNCRTILTDEYTDMADVDAEIAEGDAGVARTLFEDERDSDDDGEILSDEVERTWGEGDGAEEGDGAGSSVMSEQEWGEEDIPGARRPGRRRYSGPPPLHTSPRTNRRYQELFGRDSGSGDEDTVRRSTAVVRPSPEAVFDDNEVRPYSLGARGVMALEPLALIVEREEENIAHIRRDTNLIRDRIQQFYLSDPRREEP